METDGPPQKKFQRANKSHASTSLIFRLRKIIFLPALWWYFEKANIIHTNHCVWKLHELKTTKFGHALQQAVHWVPVEMEWSGHAVPRARRPMSSRRIFSYALGPNPGSGGSLQNESVAQITCWRFAIHILFSFGPLPPQLQAASFTMEAIKHTCQNCS